MARTESKANRRRVTEASFPVRERRVATPNPDLVVVKIGDRYQKVESLRNERESGVLARVVKALAKPGADRARVFDSTSGKRVYAYFAYSKDPTKLVREDASGRQTIGRFVSGRFRSLNSSKAD